MSSYEILSKRQISKKMRLSKTVREVYKHDNLNFFNENFDFNRPVLILTNEIILNFNTFLLCNEYHFAICSCLNIEKEAEKNFKKLNNNLIFINDEFINELSSSSNIDIRDNLKNICDYLTIRYPQGNFDVLNFENLSLYTSNTLFADLNIQKISKIPFDLLLTPNYFEISGFQNESQIENPFEKYLENLDVLHKAGDLSKGTLMISPLNSFEGEVVEKDGRVKVFGKSLNRAFQGDEVFVKDNKIVGIAKTKLRIVVGTLIKVVQFDGNNFGLVRPLDRRFSDIYVITHLNIEYVDKKVVVHIIEWKVSQILPRGIIFKILGNNGNFEDELNAILEHFHVEYRDENWNESLNRQRRSLNLPTWNSPISDIFGLKCESLGFDKYEFSVERAEHQVLSGKRKDLRHLDICSIDPIGCTDIDDALHCIKYSDYIEVGVHIADVSFYVSENSILDLEAKSRCTTVYLPQRRIDMLPPFLSSNLCSLLEGKDRAAFSCIWKFDLNFNIIGQEITRSIIKSRSALSYEKAYDIIISDVSHPLKSSLILLSEISEKLRNERMKNGSLELSTQEIYVDTVDDKFNVKVKESVPTHHLVEEFMLLANTSIAKFSLQYNPEYSLLRKHPLPSAILIDKIDCTSSKAINDFLLNLNEDQRIITKRIITRSMQQALYFSSGESSDFYHYGLATHYYTHFTSPIRRYADVLVHRTVSYILDNDEESLDRLRLYINNESCSKMNYRDRNSKVIGRMADDLYICKAVDKDEILDASVVSVKDNGVIVFIRKYGIEEFMKTKSKFTVFEKVKIKIINTFEDYCRDRMFNIVEVE